MHLSAIAVITATIGILLSGCGQSEQYVNYDGIDYGAVDSAPELSARDTTRAHLARLFLVEQPTITVNPTLLKGLKTQAPGGILFWNGTKTDANGTRKVIRTYSAKLKSYGELPMLFSMDYEGGDLGLTPSGKIVAGIQRVKTGLTKLAHPIWLGKAAVKFGPEACALHGQIIATELNSIGMNYPLGTVSDLAKKLMVLRGTSTNPAVVSECMQALLDAVMKQKDMIFVTKHFPGLADVSGDTHEGDATSSDTTLAQMEPSLKPYRDILAQLAKDHDETRLSIMSTHAIFPAIDPDRLSTESPLVLTGLLRDTLGFTGIRVSDAMWMGNYGKLSTANLMPHYVSAVLAGEDLLMIPGTKFASALTYVRALYDGKMTDAQEDLLERLMGKSFTEIRADFIARVKDVLQRQNGSLSQIRHSVDVMSAPNVVPSTLTTDIRERYDSILRALDPRWDSVLPPDPVETPAL